MHETSSPNEIAELFRTSYTHALSGTVAIDGIDGVGKTGLAATSRRLSAG
jgi:hypothetical protein